MEVLFLHRLLASTKGQYDLLTLRGNGFAFISWTLDQQYYDFSEVVTSDIELCALWSELSEDSVVVTFDTGDGASIPNQILTIGSKIKNRVPVKEGYIFKCWLLNDEEFDIESPVNTSICLVAQYEKIEDNDEIYYAKISKVDNYSPDRYITILDNNKNVLEVTKIMYSDENMDIVYQIEGTKIVVAYADIVEEKIFKVELKNGKIVTAIVQ